MPDTKDLYLDLLKKCLTYLIYDGDTYAPIRNPNGLLKRTVSHMLRPLNRLGIELVSRCPFDRQRRIEGRDWPPLAHTMIGLKRLDNIQFCSEDVLANRIPGDFIEAGVWRGGASIFMRAILKAYGITDRCVWAADSFEGLPLPNPQRYPADKGALWHTWNALAVSLDEVKTNFSRYGLLDEQVRFLKGWFSETLPSTRNQRWAVIRLDGDMYESTIDVLENLYPNLSVGGYVIIDDYESIAACRQAVLDYRQAHSIPEEIRPIDWNAAFWRREH